MLKKPIFTSIAACKKCNYFEVSDNNSKIAFSEENSKCNEHILEKKIYANNDGRLSYEEHKTLKTEFYNVPRCMEKEFAEKWVLHQARRMLDVLAAKSFDSEKEKSSLVEAVSIIIFNNNKSYNVFSVWQPRH